MAAWRREGCQARRSEARGPPGVGGRGTGGTVYGLRKPMAPASPFQDKIPLGVRLLMQRTGLATVDLPLGGARAQQRWLGCPPPLSDSMISLGAFGEVCPCRAFVGSAGLFPSPHCHRPPAAVRWAVCRLALRRRMIEGMRPGGWAAGARRSTSTFRRQLGWRRRSWPFELQQRWFKSNAVDHRPVALHRLAVYRVRQRLQQRWLAAYRPSPGRTSR